MKTTKKDRQSAALQAIQPADPRLPELLLLWYTKNARALPWRADRKPYHVWISEIMLQQTRAETVAGYYTRFLFRLPDIAALAQAGEEELLKLWEGLGYYNRVRNLQKAARLIMEKYDGVFPSKYADIRALPGIGDYTAGAISSICFEQPQPAIDGNVLRVYARLTASDLPIDLITVKKQTAAALAAVYPGRALRGFYAKPDGAWRDGLRSANAKMRRMPGALNLHSKSKANCGQASGQTAEKRKTSGMADCILLPVRG